MVKLNASIAEQQVGYTVTISGLIYAFSTLQEALDHIREAHFNSPVTNQPNISIGTPTISKQEFPYYIGPAWSQSTYSNPFQV